MGTKKTKSEADVAEVTENLSEFDVIFLLLLMVSEEGGVEAAEKRQSDHNLVAV